MSGTPGGNAADINQDGSVNILDYTILSNNFGENKESSQRLLEKVARAIEAADTLLENGLGEFATGRAYYAMFYTAEALLNEKDLRFSKHGGVHGAFGLNRIYSSLAIPFLFYKQTCCKFIT